jgi:hypothetical protein
MTPAERQRRHRHIVTHKPMTKGEREDLIKLIKSREEVMKVAATVRQRADRSNTLGSPKSSAGSAACCCEDRVIDGNAGSRHDRPPAEEQDPAATR